MRFFESIKLVIKIILLLSDILYFHIVTSECSFKECQSKVTKKIKEVRDLWAQKMQEELKIISWHSYSRRQTFVLSIRDYSCCCTLRIREGWTRHAARKKRVGLKL